MFTELSEEAIDAQYKRLQIILKGQEAEVLRTKEAMDALLIFKKYVAAAPPMQTVIPFSSTNPAGRKKKDSTVPLEYPEGDGQWADKAHYLVNHLGGSATVTETIEAAKKFEEGGLDNKKISNIHKALGRLEQMEILEVDRSRRPQIFSIKKEVQS